MNRINYLSYLFFLIFFENCSSFHKRVEDNKLIALDESKYLYSHNDTLLIRKVGNLTIDSCLLTQNQVHGMRLLRWPNDGIENFIEYRNGIKSGLVLSKTIEGSVLTQGQNWEGHPIGIWRHFFSNGKLRSKLSFDQYGNPQYQFEFDSLGNCTFHSKLIRLLDLSKDRLLILCDTLVGLNQLIKLNNEFIDIKNVLETFKYNKSEYSSGITVQYIVDEHVIYDTVYVELQ